MDYFLRDTRYHLGVETKTLKDRCHEVMLTHLKSKGYPDLERLQILQELPSMWKALDAAGLMEEIKSQGHTYQSFCNRALNKAREAAFDEHVGALAEAFNRRSKS